MHLMTMFSAGLLLAGPVAAHPGHAARAVTPALANKGATEDDAVRAVLSEYKAAIETLDVRNTQRLFTADSQIFESGGDEGNYANYLAHHLVPVLAEFRSFSFTNYKCVVRFEGPIALATETYTYRIETKKGDVAERLGVTTSALKKSADGWRIISLHSSARKPRGS